MSANQLPALLKAITQAESQLRDLRTRRDGIATQLADTETAIEALKTARQAYITGEKGAKPVDPGAIPAKRLEAEDCATISPPWIPLWSTSSAN
ncbi:MAG: hypothetical protein MZV65_42930 [Chromatiales bacterium]|nr:hypothetical protein [Chromatiales bacterium]